MPFEGELGDAGAGPGTIKLGVLESAGSSPEGSAGAEASAEGSATQRTVAQRPLTDLGRQMRDMLPPVLRRSADYLAVIHPCARELERLGGYIEQVRRQFNPASADVLLNAWETEVRLPVGGRGASIEQRQQKVVARLFKATGGSMGRAWEAEITELIGDGWTYEENIPGDLTSPPEGILRIQLPFAPDADRTIEAQNQIREVTAAHLTVEFESLGGFLVDDSHLDIEELSV